MYYCVLCLCKKLLSWVQTAAKPTHHGQRHQQQQQQQREFTTKKCSWRFMKMKEKRIESESMSEWVRERKCAWSEFNVCAVVTNQNHFYFYVSMIFLAWCGFFSVHLFFRLFVIFAVTRKPKTSHPHSQSDSKAMFSVFNVHCSNGSCARNAIQFFYHVAISALLLYTLIKPSIFSLVRSFSLHTVVASESKSERE